jgi:hypothetical protein
MQFGLPDLDLSPGDHVCAMYFGTGQRDEFLVPYLRSGLRSGDKCICVLDVTDPRMLSVLGHGLDIDDALASAQLEMSGAADTYLSSGEFVADEVLAFWETTMGTALASGDYAFVRAAGEMPKPLQILPGGIDAFMAYESELNTYLAEHPEQSLLCMYDLEVFGGGLMLELLRTHPRLLLGGLLLDNPHSLAPEDYRTSHRVDPS